ncbi:glycosyltransferase [Bacillus sp. FSL W7-1360]
MEKIKFLYIGRNLERPMVLGLGYFFNEIKKMTDFHASYSSGSIENILAQIDFKPDFIYLHEYMAKRRYDPSVTGVKKISIPCAALFSDIHLCKEERKKAVQEEEIKYVFTYYRDKFLQWYPELTDQMIWMPPEVNTDIFKDYGAEKDIDFLMTGNTHPKFYPLRAKMLETFKGRDGFFERPHPTYERMYAAPHQCVLGERYAMEINRAKMAFTCDSIYQYPVLKYYEICACNTLLLAPCSKEIRDLGFIPGEHFVEVDENDFEEKAYYYLNNEEERKRIALNGMEMVHRKHATTVRATQFIKKVEEIIAKERSEM